MTTSNTYRPRTAADNLPRSQEPGRNVGKGLLGLLAVLVLVVGIPAALIAFVGNPLPTSAPSRSWLTAEVTAGTIINVIACLVWLVWAHFVVCLIAEAHAMRAGRMPASVIFGGGPQVVARRLIATVMLLGGVATGAQAMQGGASTAVAPTPAAVSAPMAVQAVTQDAADTAAKATAEQALEQSAAPATSAVVHKYYTVQPRHGRHYDNLWDIADRHLGDPYRYREIFELNKGKLQADGRKLLDNDLIYVGWELRMPADATGPGVHSVTVAAAPPVAEKPASPTTGDQALADPNPALAFTVPAAASAHQDAYAESWMQEHGGYLAGGLVLAGLLLAVSSRRGPYGEPSENEAALRLAANPGRASFVDQAVRELAASRRAAGQPMPQISVAYASDDQLVLHVVGAVDAPGLPWRTGPDGTSWTLERADLPVRRAPGPAPYPALVAIARSHAFDLLVDLAFAPGIVALGGYDRYAREVAMSCAADLCTHAWSDFVHVTLVGFADGLSDIVGDRMYETDDADSALDAIAGQLGQTRNLLRRLGVDGVLEGRTRTRHPDLAPQVLILSAPPSLAQAERIAQLQSQEGTTLTVLVVGDTPSARWRFTVDQTGAIDLGVLGPNGQANRLSPAGTEFVRALVKDAAASARERAHEVTTPAAVTQSLAVPPSATAAYVARPAATPADAVSVHLLGPVEVRTEGPDPAQRDLLAEVVVMAALHPQGLHEGVLSANLWPRGVEEDVVAETLRRAAEWLGRGANGPRLAVGEDGLWHLSDEVAIDFGALVAAAARADDAQLLQVLDQIDGPVFSGTPAGRYTWLAFHRAARDARALITQFCHRRAAELVAGGRPADAVACLRTGVRAVPSAQMLWRELVKLLGDDPDGLHQTIDQMWEALSGERIEPETSSLVRHLTPDREDAPA